MRLLVLLAFCCILLSLSGCFILREPANKPFRAAAAVKPFDAIIVPGLPFKDGEWGKLLRSRVLWSYVLYKNGYTRNVIYSGGANYSPYKEGIIMALYARELGIPNEHILIDTLAQHSSENVYYGYEIARKKSFTSIALATDRAQSYFLKRFIKRRFSTPIYRIPVLDDSVDRYEHLNPTINYELAKVDSFVKLDEGQNLLSRIFNPEGHNIAWDKYPGGTLPPLKAKK